MSRQLTRCIPQAASCEYSHRWRLILYWKARLYPRFLCNNYNEKRGLSSLQSKSWQIGSKPSAATPPGIVIPYPSLSDPSSLVREASHRQAKLSGLVVRSLRSRGISRSRLACFSHPDTHFNPGTPARAGPVPSYGVERTAT